VLVGVEFGLEKVAFLMVRNHYMGSLIDNIRLSLIDFASY